MIITVEISHYPLLTDYEEDILAFINHIKSNDHLIVMSNSMSTYIKGDHTMVMQEIAEGLSNIFHKGNVSSTVLKIIPRDLPIEEGWLSL